MHSDDVGAVPQVHYRRDTEALRDLKFASRNLANIWILQAFKIFNLFSLMKLL